MDNARGPYWLFRNSDPSYWYLFNSLNLTQLENIYHIDNPGTTVQVLGAIVIKIVHFIFGENSLVYDVLKKPEFYIKSINIAIFILNVFILFVLGLITYYFTKNILLGFIIQLTPFLSKEISLALVLVKPESFLVFTCLLFVIVLISTIKFNIEKKIKIYLFLFAFLSGLGIATKFTFIPIIVIPLILLPKVIYKLYYLLGSLASFVFFTLPIINQYPKLWKWLVNLFIKSGRYGSGESNIIDLQSYLPNLKSYIVNQKSFFIILVLSIIVCISILVIASFKRKIFNKPEYKLLVSITIFQILQVFFVSKYSSQRYLIPALLLSGISLMLIIAIIKNIYNILTINKKIIKKIILSFCIIMLLFITFINVIDIERMYQFLLYEKNEGLDISRKVEQDFKSCAKILYYDTSSIYYALTTGNLMSGGNYSYLLKEIYPSNVFFYNVFNKTYSSWGNINIDFKEIKAKYDCIIFQGSSFERNAPNVAYTYIYGEKDEMIIMVNN